MVVLLKMPLTNYFCIFFWRWFRQFWVQKNSGIFQTTAIGHTFECATNSHAVKFHALGLNQYLKFFENQFYSCHIKGHENEIGPQAFLMVVSYGTASVVMLINIIYVQYKTKKGKDKIVKYLGRDDINPENESFHRTTIKFETQISRTVYWMFLAFTVLSLPSKWDTIL